MFSSIQRTISKCIVVSVLTSGCVTTYAEIYRTVDKDGNVIFSDRGNETSKSVELKEDTPFSGEDYADPHKANRQDWQYDGSEHGDYTTDEERYAPKKYKQLEITSPRHDTAMRSNAGEVTIAWVISPSIQSGHTAELLLDGQTVEAVQSTGTLRLSNIDRGTHTLSLQILGEDGKEVFQESATSEFHLQRQAKR